MRLAAGLRPDLRGEAIYPPGPLAAIRGDGGKGKERVGNREGRKGREGKVVKGYEG